jgi:hypothetical protein
MDIAKIKKIEKNGHCATRHKPRFSHASGNTTKTTFNLEFDLKDVDT